MKEINHYLYLIFNTIGSGLKKNQETLMGNRNHSDNFPGGECFGFEFFSGGYSLSFTCE